MEKIIYILISIALYVLLILTKKNEKKKNIIWEFLITTIILMSYNCFKAWVLHLIGVPCELIILASIDFIVVILLGLRIFLKKEIQKYYIEKKDVIFLVVLFIIQGAIMGFRFGLLERLSYRTTDAYIHFRAAKEFADTSLLEKDLESKYVNNVHMPLSYVNLGIMFKIFDSVHRIDLFKVFELFDISIYFLIAIASYFLMKKELCNKNNVLSIIICNILVLGFPLNCLLMGHHYLNIGIFLILVAIKFIDDIEKYENIYKYVILFLLNIGIIFTYNLFAPAVYIAELFFMMYKLKNMKKVVKYTIVTLFIPGMIGILYYIVPLIMKNEQTGILVEGDIFRNKISCIILWLPFTIFYLYDIIKNKKINFVAVLTVTTIIQIIIFFLLRKIGIVGGYYLFKMYNLIWVLLIVCTYRGMNILLNNEKQKIQVVPIIYFSIYLLLFVFMILNNNYQIPQMLIEEDDNLQNTMAIFGHNREMIIDYPDIFNEEEIEVLRYVEENIEFKGNNVLFLATTMQERWIQMIYDYENRGGIDLKTHEKEVKKWNENQQYEYIIVFRRMAGDMEKSIRKGRIVYETENVIIYGR